VQPAGAMPGTISPEARAQFVVPAGTREQPVRQGAKVQAGAARDNGQAASAGDLREQGSCRTAIGAGGKWLVRVRDVNQMVWNPRTFLRRGFGGTQVHTAIYRHRIATDDFAAEALCEQ